jgi:3-mercaptopyruvate sulfurtransferase SseA
MRKIFLLSLFVFSALACGIIAPQSEPTIVPTQVPPTATPIRIPPTQESLSQTEADVPRVSAADAKAAFDSGQAIIVDVRSPAAYAQEHIAGAVNISLVNIEANPAGVDLDKNKWIITYCT